MAATLMADFSRAVAKVKCFFATEIASIPPKKVRDILHAQGWKFEPVEPDPVSINSASAFGAHYGLKYLPMVIVKSPAGLNVYAHGNEALYRLYVADLNRAARQAYQPD